MQLKEKIHNSYSKKTNINIYPVLNIRAFYAIWPGQIFVATHDNIFYNKFISSLI